MCIPSYGKKCEITLIYAKTDFSVSPNIYKRIRDILRIYMVYIYYIYILLLLL